MVFDTIKSWTSRSRHGSSRGSPSMGSYTLRSASRPSTRMDSRPETRGTVVDGASTQLNSRPETDETGETGESSVSEKKDQLQACMAGLRWKREQEEKEERLLPKIPMSSEMTFSCIPGWKELQEEKQAKQYQTKANTPVVRKPIPPKGSAGIYKSTIAVKFNPKRPLHYPDMHSKARLALAARYRHKFAMNSDLPLGETSADYSFVWCSTEDLMKKVIQDIVWIRERYSQAGKNEPTDDEIIAWYDAELYVIEEECTTKQTTIEKRKVLSRAKSDPNALDVATHDMTVKERLLRARNEAAEVRERKTKSVMAMAADFEKFNEVKKYDGDGSRF